MARALALQAKGHRFDSDILHNRFEIGDFGFQIDSVLKYFDVTSGLKIHNLDISIHGALIRVIRTNSCNSCLSSLTYWKNKC